MPKRNQTTFDIDETFAYAVSFRVGKLGCVSHPKIDRCRERHQNAWKSNFRPTMRKKTASIANASEHFMDRVILFSAVGETSRRWTHCNMKQTISFRMASNDLK